MVGGKAALLKAVYDVALVGDDEPVPVGRRPVFAEIAAAPDARSCLAVYAHLGRQMFARVGPLITGVVVEGPGRDRALRAFLDTIEGERGRGTAAMARHVAGRFGLRPGLTEAEAADVLWTLTAPELADRFVRRRGWSLDRYLVSASAPPFRAVVRGGRGSPRSGRACPGRDGSCCSMYCPTTLSGAPLTDPAKYEADHSRCARQ